ncbi:MAG: TIGR00645 family protein [Alphaproteobacteria bacterium]
MASAAGSLTAEGNTVMTDSGKKPRAKEVERIFERTLFQSRWLIAPFYVGLVIALIALVIVFARAIYVYLWQVPTMGTQDAILMALDLIDVSLIANLLLIVIFSGYENFVSKIDTDGHEDRPDWMGSVNFGDLKMKLIASVTAISAITLLKHFITITKDKTISEERILIWIIAMTLTFVISGVLLALMDKLKGKGRG